MQLNTVILNYRKGLQPLREAFENIGYEVVEQAWAPDPALLARTELCVVNLYEAIRNPWTTVGLRRRLKRAGIPLIGLDRDAPWHMGIRWRRMALFRLLRPLDIHASHTLQPTWNFAPVKIYSPNAVWVRNYNLHGHSLEEMREPGFYKYDVSFLGNIDGVRYREHAARAAFLAALGARLTALGIRHRLADAAGIPLAEQIELIQRTRINLNVTVAADHGGSRSWGLPERCYGVPACGGFLLSDERRHAGDDFDLKTEWACYSDLDDCVAKIQYWLRHFEESRKIAEAAHARVMLEHTYEQRARNLVAVTNRFRSERLNECIGNGHFPAPARSRFSISPAKSDQRNALSGGHSMNEASMRSMQKILVIRRDNIGDLVCTTPLLHALRRQLPQARIECLVTRYNRAVLVGHPDIDALHDYTKAKHRLPGESVLGIYWRRLLTIRTLRRQDFDWVILPGGGSASALRFARWIAGKHLLLRDARDAAAGPHEVEQCCHLLSRMGLQYETPAVSLTPGAAEIAALRSRLDATWTTWPRRLVGLHISARKPSQRWPAENFANLARRLTEAGTAFLLLWAPGQESNPQHPGDDEKAARVLEMASGLAMAPVPTRHLEELIAALSLCDTVICGDGGAMHLAAGLGKTIVCLFGQSSAARWHPWGVRYELLQMPSMDVRDISVDAVVDAYARLPERCS